MPFSRLISNNHVLVFSQKLCLTQCEETRIKCRDRVNELECRSPLITFKKWGWHCQWTPAIEHKLVCHQIMCGRLPVKRRQPTSDRPTARMRERTPTSAFFFVLTVFEESRGWLMHGSIRLSRRSMQDWLYFERTNTCRPKLTALVKANENAQMHHEITNK